MNRQLGADLRYHRMRQVMSCEEVAEMVGTTPEQVLSWERSESVPDREAVQKLGLLFGVSPADLLGEDDPAADTAGGKETRTPDAATDRRGEQRTARGTDAPSGFDHSANQGSPQEAGAWGAGAQSDGAPGAGSRGADSRSDGAWGAGSQSDGAWSAGSQNDGVPGAGSRGADSRRESSQSDGAWGAGAQSDGVPGAGSRGADSRGADSRREGSQSEGPREHQQQAAGIPPFPRGVAEAVFTPYLMPGETLLWYGQPDPSQVFQRQDIFLLPFGLFFFVFALFWMSTASMAGGAFALFGLPFVGVGAYLLFGRLIHTKEVKKYTHYAITDRRVLLLYRGSRVTFRDIALSQLGQLSLESSTAGPGTVRIRGLETVVYHNHRAPYYQGAGQGFGSAAMLSGLVHIPQAEQVFHLLRRLSPEFPPAMQP
ncbi:MAG: helix-turn-helix domain-containing protein [Eubacteriales bacterium]